MWMATLSSWYQQEVKHSVNDLDIWGRGWKFIIKMKHSCLQFKNCKILTVKYAAVYKNYHLCKENIQSVKTVLLMPLG